MTAPLFHGDDAAASTPAALRRFDEETPVWSVGSVDPGTGVWTPHRLPALIVLAPHPDDEVLGAAPLIVAALRAGAEVVVVAATDGEGSHAPDVIDPAELAAIRRRESEEAAEVLAAPFQRPGAPALRWVRLALPDGSLAEREDDVVRALEEVAASLPPESWLVSTLPHDGHPDHEACGRAAERAAARNRRLDLVHVPVWLWHHRRPGDAGTAWDRARTVPVDAEAARAREAALACFRSQRTAALGRAVDRPEGAPVVPDAALEAMLRDRLVVFPAPAVDFTALYGSSADPWAVEGRWYEQRKFELTMVVLPRRRFGRAFEPACSTGWLSARLAERCDRLVATDLVPAALEAARERVRAGNVVFAEGSASDVPEGPLDLVVLSEVGYYLSGAELVAFLERARAELAPDGVLVAAHWRHAIAEAHRTGDEVHRALAAVPGWARHASYADDDVLIELFGPPAPSVAEAEFLAEEEDRRER